MATPINISLSNAYAAVSGLVPAYSSALPAVPGMPRLGAWTVADERGQDLVEFTSFIGLAVSSGADAPRQPVERGGFYAYNKVASPVEATVTLAVQGDSATFQRVLDTLNTFTREARCISVITPEREFAPMTLTGFNYTRKAEEGVSMLIAELKIREVRLIPPRYSNTAITREQAKNPMDVSSVNFGLKRPVSRPDLIMYAI